MQKAAFGDFFRHFSTNLFPAGLASANKAENKLLFFEKYRIMIIETVVPLRTAVQYGVAPGSIAGARKGKHAEERVTSIKHSA